MKWKGRNICNFPLRFILVSKAFLGKMRILSLKKKKKKKKNARLQKQDLFSLANPKASMTSVVFGINFSFVNSFETTFDSFEPTHDKTACEPSEDSDQPGHTPSLISVFAVRLIVS